ncbi:MAG: hypothetical protein ACI8W7_001676 [Gammaproteobacteria bacterium]|jgi:hypothetical protein
MHKKLHHVRNRSQAYARTALLCAVAVLGITGTNSAHAQTALPTGFGSFTLGMHWDDVQSSTGLVELTRINSAWERLVYDCGYRHAQITTDKGRLLVTVEDFTVTSLSYVTAIQKDSNLMQVAQLIINNYGQPQQATMRDALGAVTIDQSTANYITLEFGGDKPAMFEVSGAPMWEYRISIQNGDLRGTQNRTIRCARKQEKRLKNESAKKPS